MRLSKWGCIALSGLVCALTACDSDLPSYNQVEGLRVLAVASDPPWVPAGSTSTVTALVVADGPVTATWSWCPRLAPADEGFACLDPRPLEALATGEDGPRARFVAPADLDGLCAQTEDMACEQGAEVFVRLEVDDGQAQLVAIRPLWLPRSASERHNNPGIAGVGLRAEGVQSELSESMQMDLPWARTATLTVDPAPDAAEPTPEGPEQLTASWFVDHGELEHGRIRVDEGRPGPNPWTLPDTPVPAARIFVVLRDGRGGTSWRTFSVQEPSR